MTSRSNLHIDDKPSGSFLSSSKGAGRCRLIVFLVLFLGIGFMIGILIGKFAICNEETREGVFLPGVSEHLMNEADPDISKKIIDGIDPKRIEANLRKLSQYPHIAGRSRDFEIVQLLKSRYEESGLQVQITPYEVLLSYPNNTTPNSVRLLHANGTIEVDSINEESNFSRVEGVVPPYNAFSPSRNVQGQLVYAGYGRVDDYNFLRQNNINVSGHIVIVKYGKIFRGDKVDTAAANGAIGIIIYSDPADCTGIKMNDSRVYPETWWLPPSGAQRGTVFTGDGDPLTPGYPANNLAYRYSEDTVVPPLPKIPSHPIGYGAAKKILSKLAGQDVTSHPDFGGGLNIIYRTGPGFIETGMLIQLNVTTSNKIEKAENVFGIIKGTVEPDRYVFYGNHRDAWIYGAIDPSTGTAVMMEVARVMGELVQRGEWKPRRSIVFCSWGAEEFGLIGSTEWAEQYVSTLRERAVAYINVDIAVQGNDTFEASATPLMYNIIHEASQKVKNPNPSEIQANRGTVYDTWLHQRPWDFAQGDKSRVPLIGSLGSGSDYAPLLQRAGITAVDLRYTFDSKVYGVSSYPLYHTEYETFDMVKQQMDKDFEYHAAVARVSGEALRALADSLILPFNVTNYAAGLEISRKALEKDYGAQLRLNLNSSTFDKLEEVIKGFAADVFDFEARLKTINKMNPFEVRKVNDQMLLLEKAFLHPEGLPSRSLKKHLIFAENMNDSYASSSFPGLVDLLFEIEKDPKRWEQVKKHFHTILTTIQAAGATLRGVTKFMSETL